MKIAITCDNDMEFKFVQKLAFEAGYMWNNGKSIIIYPYLELVKVLLYLDDDYGDKKLFYGRFINYDRYDGYKLFTLNDYNDYNRLLDIFNLEFDQDYNKINNIIPNLYKPRKRKIDESVILKFNDFIK